MDYKNYLVRSVRDANIKVRLGTPVDATLIKTEAPDVVIAAVGSEPVVPSIPGIDCRNVLSAIEAHDENASIGEQVVIIGGGLVGCETALVMAELGKEVTVLEMLPQLAGDDPFLHKVALLSKLNSVAKTYTNHTVTGITESGVYAKTPESEEVFFPADTIVYSVGMNARTSVLKELEQAANIVLAAGDCIRARRIQHAVSEARAIAETI